MVKINKIYYVSNSDLGLDGSVPGHQVIVVRKSKKRKMVKIKTITSLESPSKNGEKRKLKSSKLDLIKLFYDGEIIVIPNKYLNTPKLSGVYTKGIWIPESCLKENKFSTKISKKYLRIIGK